MLERYIRLYALANSMYRKNAPILIEAGALLKDTQTKQVLAQLKFKNISDKIVKAVKVRLIPKDIADRHLDDEVEYQYLDLALKRDEVFGTKDPIYFNNDAIRSYDVVVTEVVFSDNILWSDIGAWDSLQRPQTLKDYFKDNELVEQFKIEYGAASKIIPMETHGLWYCACGRINRTDENKCSLCEKNKNEVFLWNKEILESLCEERVARQTEEKRKHDEKIKKEHDVFLRKTKKISIALITVIMISFLFVEYLLPVIYFNIGEDLSSKGEYAKAIQAFEKSGKRDDIKDKIAYCKYMLVTENKETISQDTYEKYMEELYSQKDYKEKIKKIYEEEEENDLRGQVGPFLEKFLALDLNKEYTYESLGEALDATTEYMTEGGVWYRYTGLDNGRYIFDIDTNAKFRETKENADGTLDNISLSAVAGTNAFSGDEFIILEKIMCGYLGEPTSYIGYPFQGEHIGKDNYVEIEWEGNNECNYNLHCYNNRVYIERYPRYD